LAGAAFASAIWGEPQFVASAASIPERESVSPIEMQIEDESERANRRLMERAQALAAYRAPKPAKKREVQAVFGGASTLLFDQASRLPSVRSTSSQKLCRRA
jgi:hypothetical protein